MTTTHPGTPAAHTNAPTPVPGGNAELHPVRLRSAKFAYTTRFAAAAVAASADGYHLRRGPGVRPRAGDLVLARVVEIGSHRRLEGPQSRRQMLFPGDEIVVAYGARYAPDQFLAEVPEDLRTCHLVAAGGVAGSVVAQHASMDDATVIEPVGLLADAGGTVTLDRLAPQRTGGHAVTGAPARGTRRPAVVAVLGTSMNSGKTTTVASLVNGLTRAGLVVSAGKATGTGAGGDANLFRDAGAARVLDFTDFGLPSTYRLAADRVRELWIAVVDQLSLDGPDVVVVEVADGIFQAETSRLLADLAFADRVDAVLFAAQDALGAIAGVERLQSLGLPVRAVSGLLTASPLTTAEASAAITDTPVVVTPDLCDPTVACSVAGVEVASR
ncbi:MAG TPA: hypothetical protein VNT31_12040 [Nocardioides sp.]|nr:hypothetical protein [Nocardioides sp.]